MPTEEQILDSMRHIMDPDLGRDIVSLGFIKNVSIDGGAVSFTVELTTPACPMKSKFREMCEESVRAVPGVTSVDVTMGAQQARRQQAPSGVSTLQTVDAVIAVSSCKGGVGKSTVAAHLAKAMVREGLAVGLLDADVYGPSMPTLFNIHNPQMFSRENRILPMEQDGLKLMSLGFLLGEAPAVLRGPIVSGYIQQILTQTDWGKLDYLIIDLPPGTGDIQLTIVQQAALDGAIIVTTPQALSLVDVAKGIVMFEKVDVPVLGVVENMSSYTCDKCDAVHYPFGRSQSALQAKFGIETLAELPIAAGIADLDTDTTADAMQQLAENVHRAVGKSRAQKDDAPKVEAIPGHIHVTWSDGTEVTIENHKARCACPCASCVDEHTGVRTLDADTVPQDIAVESIQPLGNYAVVLTWSDQHSTGIYSWDLLRELGS